MPGPPEPVHVVGGGLAGCEAALQLARCGVPVVMHEMRPVRTTAAHRTDSLAEIVCSNSLKSVALDTGAGLLKAELARLGCRLLEIARAAAVPAGAALAVDREAFAAGVQARIIADPAIALVREEITALPPSPPTPWIVATGPLTSNRLQVEIARFSGHGGLHFYDAIAPSVSRDSLDESQLFRAARYGKGEPDYLNAPLDRDAYLLFHHALVTAERAELHALDRRELFSGCQPLEEIAASGLESLAFGPLRPVGLRDPRSGRRPHAVVQLRQENRDATLYGLVGFQTRLKWSEQKRVFRLIPGLERAEFVRFGQLHRNFYLDTPRMLDRRFALPAAPDVHFAGQVVGVEGYVESIASGLVTAWLVAAQLRGIALPAWPATTLTGALLFGFLFDRTTARLAPMNANFGLLPPLAEVVQGRRQRKEALARRALTALEDWLGQPAVTALLAGSVGQ